MAHSRSNALTMLAITAAITGVWGQSYNTIDAVTSASGRFKIISGKAYATTAEITWWDYWNNGTQHLLKWGVTTNYGSQINLKPFTRQTNITTTITGLTPNTQYYGQFYRPYDGTTYTTDFTFTTAAATVSVSQPLLITRKTLTGPCRIEYYTPAGRIICAEIATAGPITLSRLASFSRLHRGTHIAVLRNAENSSLLGSARLAVDK